MFPRKTKASPTDDLCFFDAPGLFLPPIDEIHISVAFTYDIPRAEWLAEQWRHVAPVKVGGPAYNERGGEFIPGMYLKQGYVITSRGCNNNCWFCSVPKREGRLHTLPIAEGWNVLDDNLLACPDDHVNAVFDMLARQDRRPEFTGGLEAKIIKPWHAKRLKEIKTKRLYMAYDTPDDYEPLVEAGKMLLDAGFTTASHTLGCYCLIGYRGDSYEAAAKRMRQAAAAGFVPMAMLYRDNTGRYDLNWRRFQREWARPILVVNQIKEVTR